MADSELNPSDLQKEYEQNFPPRLREFYTSDEWKSYEGHQVSGLAYFSSDVRSPVTFRDRDELGHKYEYASEFGPTRAGSGPCATYPNWTVLSSWPPM